MAKKPRRLASLDFETDPFKAGRVPKPFCVEFYSDDMTEVFWGDDCVEKLMSFLSGLEEDYDIYAHNGGRFDFFFMFDYFDTQTPKIINGRIVRAKICGRHFLYDSFAIMPVPLKSYDKGDIDYHMMERVSRETHKREILDYLHRDCLSLYDMVCQFKDLFGNELTIGATSIKQMMKIKPLEKLNAASDNFYRQFYFGGRVQAFRSGVLKGPWKMVDANSMYPAAMKNFKHPFNGEYSVGDKLPNNFDAPFFAIVDLVNRNALPWREPGDPETNIRRRYKKNRVTGEYEEVEPERLLYSRNGISFTKERGKFFVCSHELEVALKYGLVDIEKVHEVHVANSYGTFEEFVDLFYARRNEAKANNDKKLDLFWKLILNAGYGKWGQNARDYEDYYFNRCDETGLPHNVLIEKGYSIKTEYEEFELWARPTFESNYSFFDVGVASSITSASRATLMEALSKSVDPIYCDTDSILCREFYGDVDDKKLGAWKHEATAEYAVIAGKKLYALTDDVDVPADDDPVWSVAEYVKRDKTGGVVANGKFFPVKNEPLNSAKSKWSSAKTIKLASKGAKLSLHNLIEIASGEEVLYVPDAPIFSLNNRGKFFKRRIRKTIEEGLDIGYKNLTANADAKQPNEDFHYEQEE
jgi:hypothetical protein